jgi:hypothetical protein
MNERSICLVSSKEELLNKVKEVLKNKKELVLIETKEEEEIFKQIFLRYETLPFFDMPPLAPKNNHKPKRYFSD